MRVLMLSWEYPPNIVGGMGAHVAQLVPAMLAADPDLALHVVTPIFGPQVAPQVADRLTVSLVSVVPPQSSDYFAGVWRANHELERVARAVLAGQAPFDLIHAHDWLVSFTARALVEASGIPLVTTVHATERGRNRGYLTSPLQWAIQEAEQLLAQASDQLVVCSQPMIEEARQFLEVSSAKLELIPNGVDSQRFDSLRTRDHARFRCRFAMPEEFLIFNIGRLVYEKGADLLVEAAPKVLQHVPQAKFVIAGRGPLLPVLQHRIDALGLHGKILLAGYLADDERDRLYLLADCCVFPSRYEPFGIVALEAMAAGTPVVVSNVDGLGTVVEHEKTGISVYSENVDSLAWGILRTLQDPTAATQRAALASQVVQTRFSWDRVAAMTLDLYQRTLANLADQRQDPGPVT